MEPHEAVRGRMLGKYFNYWRMRVVFLFEHTGDPDRVVSVGRPFRFIEPSDADRVRSGLPHEGLLAFKQDGKGGRMDDIVCVELRSQYAKQLKCGDWSPFY